MHDSSQITNLLMLGVLCFKLPSLVEPIVSTVTRNLIQLLREERAGLCATYAIALKLTCRRNQLPGRGGHHPELAAYHTTHRGRGACNPRHSRHQRVQVRCLTIIVMPMRHRVDARLSKLTTEALVHAAEMDMISFVVAASAELDEPQHQSQYKILQV